MSILTAYPISMQDRLELGPEEVRLSGSFEDFCNLLGVCEYPIEYQHDEIILMSYASDPHEQIVANLLGELHRVFKGKAEYHRYGSNRPVYIAEPQCSYNPDASVVFGKPVTFEFKPGQDGNINPWLIAEVLSECTQRKDMGEKLPRYKRIPSLRFILYIEQDTALITLHYRSDENGRWASTDYNSLTDIIVVDQWTIQLRDIYENVVLSG